MGEDNKKSFISEKILGRDMTFQRAFKYLLVSLLCGLVFGAAVLLVVGFGRKVIQPDETAASSTAQQAAESTAEASSMAESTEAESSLSETVAESSLSETETSSPSEETAESLKETAESKSTEESAAGPEETDSCSESSEETTAVDAEAVKQLIREELETKEAVIEDLTSLRALQQEAIRNVIPYLTVVGKTISETTWFESTVETKQNYAGVIVGKNEKEIQVLTVTGAIPEEGNLTVTFHDGSCQKAVVRKKDTREGLAVLAVSVEGLGSKLTESIEEIPVYGDDVSAGQPILTAGAPLAVVNSFDFGLINYQSAVKAVVDGSREPLYTKAASHPEKGTFLLTLDGKLIGFARAEKDSEVDGNRFVMVRGLTGLIENMKKGSDTAYLGITGSDISFDMKTENIPEGMLVTDIEDASPAETAGIKRGDIIVSIGSREIKGLADYCSFMRNLRPEETSVMTVSRGERGTFRTIEIEITAAVR